MKSLLFIPLLFCTLFASAQETVLYYATNIINNSSFNETNENYAYKIQNAPDVFPAYGPSSNTWTSATEDDGREYISMGFQSQVINRVYIYQTNNPGAIDTVYIRTDSKPYWQPISLLSENTTNAVANILIFDASASDGQAVDAVRIALNSPDFPGYNEIDAVAIANIVDEPTVSIDPMMSLTVNGTNSGTIIPAVIGLADGCDTVYWASSDENVATVDPYGVVTAYTPGIATITATIGTGATATCRVKVDMGFGTNPLFDFELTTNNFLGTGLFTFTDKSQSPAGNSTITPETIDIQNPENLSTPGAFGTSRALTLTYMLDQGVYPYEPYAAVAFNTSNTSNTATDLSQYSGISFWHKGSGFTLFAKLLTTNSNQFHHVDVPSSDTWKYEYFYWDNFEQVDWTDTYIPWDASKIEGFNFQVYGEKNGGPQNGNFSLDEIEIFTDSAHPAIGVLDQKFIVMRPGSDTTISAVNSTVMEWSTDNAGIAINDGILTAMYSCEANITATFYNETTAWCRVIVEDAPTINKLNLTLEVGKTDTLEVKTFQNITWTSSNPAIASVNDSVVTAVAPGTATITAVLEDGSKYTCTVTVADDNAGRETTKLIDFNDGKAYSQNGAKITTEVFGGATISPENPIGTATPGATGTGYSIEFAYTLPEKCTAYAKIELPQTTDISTYDGIQFWYKGDETELRIMTETDKQNNFSDFSQVKVLTCTEWTKYVFRFDTDFRRNDDASLVEANLIDVYNFTFSALNATGTFAFDEVALFNDVTYTPWETVFAEEHNNVYGIDNIIKNRKPDTWKDRTEKGEYTLTPVNDTLTVNFTAPSELPHTGSFDCYFIDRTSLTDPFKTSNDDPRDSLRGTSVDMSAHPLVSFAVRTKEDLTLLVGLIDKNGKVSNRDTNYYYIRGSDKWQTISFAWDMAPEATHFVDGAYDSKSTSWFNKPNAEADRKQYELDMNNIIGLNFIIDHGYIDTTGTQKQLEICKLAIGDVAVPQVLPRKPKLIDIQYYETTLDRHLGYNTTFDFEPGIYNSASIEIDFRGEQGPNYQNSPMLVVNNEKVELEQYLPKPDFSTMLWADQGNGQYRVNTAFHVSVPIPIDKIIAGEPNVLTLWPNADFVKIAKMRLALYGGEQTAVPVTKLVLPASKMLSLGATLPLSPTIYPTNATQTTLTWYSDNDVIAKVDPTGTVTGISEGTAYIYCTSESGVSTYCAVTVTNVITDPKSITLSPMTLGIGGSASMEALVMPAEAIYPALVWKSSDAIVATVDDNGTVTGRVPGTATITASIPKTNISATALVTVSAAKTFSLIQIPEITLIPSASSAVYDLANYVKILTDTVTWKCTYVDKVTAEIIDGKLKVSMLGTATTGSFILTATGTNGYTSQMLVNVKYVLDPVSGTKNIKVNLNTNGTPAAIALKSVFESYVTNDDALVEKNREIDGITVTIAKDSVTFSTSTVFSSEQQLILTYKEELTNIFITSSKLDNAAPEIKAIPEQISVQGVFAQIDLTKQVTDDYTIPAYIRWTAGSSAKVRVSISGTMAIAQLVSTAWIGSEAVWLYAQDADDLRDSVQVLFTNTYSSGSTGATSAFIDFKANKLIATPNTDILFTANLAGADYWIWEFPGATPKKSEQLNQTVRYANLGKYSVKLSAEKGEVIDSTVKKNYIQIVGITTRDTTICAGATVKLAVSAAISGHTWSTGSTDASISVSPDKTTKYAISFRSGLRTMTDTITVTVTPAANLGADTAICSGQKLVLNPGTYTSYKWSNDAISQTFTVADAGTYAVTVSSGLCQSSDAITVTVKAVQPVQLGADTALCPAKTLVLTAREGSAYKWNDGSTAQSRTISAAGIYSVSVTDANECVAVDSIAVSIRVPAVENVCVLTTSVLSTSAIVAWERTQNAGIEHYIVYRDGLGGFKPLDTIAFADGGRYVDASADINRTQYTYALATMDACGTVGALSAPHTSMHVQKFIDANGDYALRWNSYVGKDVLGYRIFIEDGTPDMKQIDSIPQQNTSYTILKSDNKKKYRVAAVFADTCVVGRLKSDSGPFSQSLSNLSEAIVLSSEQRSVTITAYPNPTAGLFSITVNALPSFEYSITNGEGKQVATGTGAGTVKVDISAQPAGVYHLSVEHGKWCDQREIVKE